MRFWGKWRIVKVNLKKESKAEIILWEWLTTKGISVKSIYFNKKTNIVLAPYFQTKGLHKKPDLLIEIDGYFGKKYIAVEVKTSDHNREIHDAGKIMDYYKNYVFNKTKYLINGEEVVISHFVIATENSNTDLTTIYSSALNGVSFLFVLVLLFFLFKYWKQLMSAMRGEVEDEDD